MGSPNLAEKLATDTLATRLAVRHHAPARTEDRDAHARAHSVDTVVANVDSATGRGHPSQSVDRGLTVSPVTKEHREGLGVFAFADPDVVEVAIGLHHARDVLLEPGVRHLDAIVSCEGPVADAGQHVGD